jgi:hypothetical protein
MTTLKMADGCEAELGGNWCPNFLLTSLMFVKAEQVRQCGVILCCPLQVSITDRGQPCQVQVVPYIFHLHLSGQSIYSDAINEIAILFTLPLRQTIDRFDDLIGKSKRPQRLQGNVSIFDNVVKHGDNLFRLGFELEHQPQRVKNIRLPCPVFLRGMRSAGQRNRFVDCAHHFPYMTFASYILHKSGSTLTFAQYRMVDPAAILNNDIQDVKQTLETTQSSFYPAC